MIQVLIAAESPGVCQWLSDLFELETDICTVAQVSNGRDAVLLTARLRPQVVLMSATLPPLDGYLATRELMTECPTPVILLTSEQDALGSATQLKALQMGAMAVGVCPGPVTAAPSAEAKASLLESVRLFSQVKAVRQHRRLAKAEPGRKERATRQPAGLVAIAASTGGPRALAHLLASLPVDYPLPILVVQHITTGFTQGLVHWLDGITPLRVKLAEEGERPTGGTVYLADSDYHLEVTRFQRLALSADAPEGGFRPSANRLFRSVAESHGRGVVAIILTGMGSDGVEGLRAVKASGGRILAQDELSSVVFGMPKAAIEAGLADAVLDLERLTTYLCTLTDSLKLGRQTP